MNRQFGVTYLLKDDVVEADVERCGLVRCTRNPTRARGYDRGESIRP